MAGNDTNLHRDEGASPPKTDPVDAKRAAARRRFLRGGAVASAGLIVTVYHTRGFAGTKTFVLSSAEACMSLTGTTGKQVKKQDSITPFVYDKKGNLVQNKVIKYECTKK